MTGLLLFILVVVALLTVVVGIVAGRRGECNREEKLRTWASELGLGVQDDTDSVPRMPYRTFSVFRPGVEQDHPLTFSGCVVLAIGEDEYSCDVLMGDVEEVDEAHDHGMPWWYRAAAGPSTRAFSYLLLRLPFDDLPSMRIRHRRGPVGFGVTAGWDLLQTEWVKFNRHVRVACRDKRFGSHLVSNRMMAFLVDHPAWPIIIQDGWICMTDAERQWTSSEYRNSLEWMRAFLAMWPEHLVDTIAGGSEWPEPRRDMTERSVD